MNARDSAAEKTAIAAHLYIALRRKFNRVIDVEWLVRNEEYALEIIALGRKPGLEELSAHLNRLEQLVLGKPTAALPENQAKVEEDDELEDIELNLGGGQYVGSLR